MEAAGFDPRMAKLALERFDGDIMKAAEELLANDGILSGDLSNICKSIHLYVKQPFIVSIYTFVRVVYCYHH